MRIVHPKKEAGTRTTSRIGAKKSGKQKATSKKSGKRK